MYFPFPYFLSASQVFPLKGVIFSLKMCSQRDFICEIQQRLKGVQIHHAETTSININENGLVKPTSVISSSSGRIYKLDAKIDDVQKGLGVVRKAFELRKESMVLDYQCPLAVKIYPVAHLRTSRVGDDFIQEIANHHLASKLATENFIEGIVPFLECLFNDDCLMMVMPFYNRKDLFYYLTQNSGLIPVDEVKPIFRRIVNAVAMLHENGYIHRDISCENIYFHSESESSNSSESCKRLKKELDNTFDLGDFGMSSEVAAVSTLSQDLGKPSYKSPQLVSKTLASVEDWKSNDVWGLGVVLYLLLMKAFPFSQARTQDPLFLDRVVKGKFEFRARQELSRSCYEPHRKDMEERLLGIQLVQRILALKIEDRPSAASIRGDNWLKEDFASVFKNPPAFCGNFAFNPPTEMQQQFVLLMDEAVAQERIAIAESLADATSSTVEPGSNTHEAA